MPTYRIDGKSYRFPPGTPQDVIDAELRKIKAKHGYGDDEGMGAAVAQFGRNAAASTIEAFPDAFSTISRATKATGLTQGENAVDRLSASLQGVADDVRGDYVPDTFGEKVVSGAGEVAGDIVKLLPMFKAAQALKIPKYLQAASAFGAKGGLESFARGEEPADIAKHAGTEAALGALFTGAGAATGALGRAGVLSASGQRLAHGATGAAIGGGMSAMQGAGVEDAAASATLMGLLGLAGGGRPVPESMKSVAKRAGMKPAEMEEAILGVPKPAPKQRMPAEDIPREETVEVAMGPPRTPPAPTAAEIGQANIAGAQQPSPETGIKVPEVVEFIQELTGGPIPVSFLERVGKKLPGGLETLGRFIPAANKERARFELRSDLDQNLLNTMVHEVGHFVKYLAMDGRKQTGNILGHVANIQGYMRDTVEAIPNSGVAALARAEKDAIMRQAVSNVKARGLKLKDSKDVVKAEYRNLVEQEAAARGLVTQDAITRELAEVSAIVRPIGPEASAQSWYTKYRQDPGEMYADAVGTLLADPALMAKTAPKFTDMFHRYIEAKPEVAVAYHKAMRLAGMTDEQIAAHRSERVADMIDRGTQASLARFSADQPETFNDIVGETTEAAKTVASSISRALVDRHAAYYKAEKEAVRSGKRLERHERATHMLEQEAYADTKRAYYIDRMNNTIAKAAEEVGLGQSEVARIMLLRRVAKEGHLAGPLGIAGKDAQQLLDMEIAKLGPQKWARLEAGLEGYHREAREMIFREMETDVAVPRALIEQFRNNPEYARIRPIKYVLEAIAKNPGANSVGHQVFKKRLGTLQEVADPLLETVVDDLYTIKFIQHNRSASTAVKMLRDIGEDVIKADWKGPEIGFGRAPEGMGLVSFHKDLKLEGYWVPKRFAKSFESLGDIGENQAIYDAYRVFVSPWRELIVNLNLGWMYRNLPRDIKALTKNVVRGDPFTSMYEGLKYSMRAAPESARAVFKTKIPEGTDVAEMYAKGMLAAPNKRIMNLADESFQQQNAQLAKMVGAETKPSKTQIVSDKLHLEWIRKPLAKVVDAIHKAGEFTEKVPKVAAYKYLKDNQQRLGLSDADIWHEVVDLAGTPNYMRRGDAYKFYNSIFMFSNINKEGWRQSWEAATTRPGEYAAKTAVYDIMPKAAMALAASGYFGPKLKEWFAGVSQYDLENYIVIPLGYDENGKRVYTRVPHDHTGQAVGAAAWRLWQEPTNMKKLIHLVNQHFPFALGGLHPVLESGMQVAQWSTGINPTDMYYGTPMLSSTTFEAGGPQAEWAFIKRIVENNLGGVIFKAGRDTPREVASIIEQATQIPYAGRALESLVKVSDSGLTGERQRLRQKFEQQKARERMGKDEFIKSQLEENMDADPRTVYLKARAEGIETGAYGDFKRRHKYMLTLMRGNAYEIGLAQRPDRDLAEMYKEKQEREEEIKKKGARPIWY